jgi:spermidine synthase
VQVLPSLLYVLVALSGASALVYEIVWIRAIGLHFGTTTPAITTVVATLMGGMGLGNWLFGALADRNLRPLALYRRIELGIAVSALSVSLVLLRAGEVLDTLSRLCANAGTWALPLRALVLALLMLAPCTLIGGTLPVLSRAVVRRGYAGRGLGALYACNTLGAIAGALLPDFALIPLLGLTAAACCAAAGNALVAWAAGRLQIATEPSSPPSVAQLDDAPSEGPTPGIALLLTATSGYGAMGLEVLWGRTLQHWASALATSFSVLLAVYLAALALGAALTRARADRAPAPLQTAALLCALSGAAALVPIALAPAWRDFERALWPRPPELRRVGLLREAVDALLHATFLEGATCLIMGAAFPYLAAAFLRSGGAGKRTGQLFTVNTVAGVLGAVFVGFVWLPSLGELGSYCAAALVLSLFGTLGAFAQAPRSRLYSAAALCCTASVLGLSLLMPASHLMRAHFRSGGYILAVREGSTTTAAAAQRFAFGERSYRELLTPGVSMSSTSQGARHYMGMMAHVALLAARKNDRALLICYGVGNTASALLSHASLRSLDVVDISEEVLALAPWFAKARGDDPLHDPRTHVFVDDGRHHLITHDTRYDVITAEPPPPNHAGVVNLYSRELYRLAKQHLAQGGVITQWLPVFQLSDGDIRAMIAAFVAELPHTALLYGYDKHFVLIGGTAPLAIDPARAKVRAADTRVRADLRADGIGDWPDVLGTVLQTDAELRRLVAGVPPLSDDRPVIQYPWQALGGYPSYAALFGRSAARATTLLPANAPADAVAEVKAAARATEQITSVLHLTEIEPPEQAELRVGNAMRLALEARPGNDGPLELLGLGTERARGAQRALRRPNAPDLLALTAEQAQAAGRVAEHAAVVDPAWTLARRAFYLGDYREASVWLARIRPSADDAARHALLTAGCLRAQHDPERAAAAFRRAASLSHDPTFARHAQRLAQHAADPMASDTGPLASD